jgi:predicted nucleic acid-binding protein
VWLSYLLQDKHRSEAEKSLKRIEEGSDAALVSTLVLLEVIEVIRKRIPENEGYTGLTSTAIKEIKTKIDEKIREFIDKITKLSQQKKAKIVDPDKLLKSYFKETLNLLSPNFGEITEFDYCFVCERNTKMRYKYRGLGHYDLQHAINARDCCAKEIVSADKGFSQLRKISEFDSLKVTIL